MQELDMNRIPKHIAVICDGNGRWAKAQGKPRTFGHRKGGFNIRDIAQAAGRLGVKCISFFCFSTENWSRPDDEVKYLMSAPIMFINKFLKTILDGNGRIHLIGRRDRIPKKLLETFEMLEEKTKDHTGIDINLCVDYGSYDELSTAIKEIAKEYKDGVISLDDIDKNLIDNHLFTKDCPPLDLLIRTSGEQRISNFFLLQLAYAELYFTPVPWPEFDENELKKAIIDFQNRDRRFGGLKK